MLTLTRRIGETLVFATSDGPVFVKLMPGRGKDQVKLAIDAPKTVAINRLELLLARMPSREA